MEEKKNIFQNKKLLLIIPVLLVIAVIGVTYAFFNYTRTGAANTISTGKINFQSSQSANPVSVSNLFPTTAPTTGGISGYNAATADFARILVTVEGETTYEAGLDYTISAVDVDLSVGTSNSPLPLKVHVYEDPTYTHTGTLDNTGDANDDTFSASASFGTAANLSGTKTASKIELASGHIAGDSTWTGGSRYTRHIIIDAYILSTDIAITDTPLESSEWINGRTTYSTSEWNALSTSGASFKILVESNETSLSNQNASPAVPTIASCLGCKFVYTEEHYYYSANNEGGEPLSTMATFTTNGDTLVDDYTVINEPYFLGFKFDGSGNVTETYACGINADNNNTPFCLKGALSDEYGGSSATRASVFSANVGELTTAFPSCDTTGSDPYCGASAIAAQASDNGDVYNEDGAGGCNVYNNGLATCG